MVGIDDKAVQVFQALLPEADVADRRAALDALRVSARISVWRRDQPCAGALAGGRVGCLLEGLVRRYCVRADGHRQIVDIVVAGDFIGLVPLGDHFMIEAVSNHTRIASFPQAELARLAVNHPAIAHLLRDRWAAAIRRLEDHLLVQNRITALEKVGGYLMLLRQRTTQANSNGLLIPISRYDIADHLGLAVETVSRAMSTLRRNGVISMTSPRQLEFPESAIPIDHFDEFAPAHEGMNVRAIA